MSLTAKLRRAPTRVAAGAYILNSGLGKLRADDETAKGTHGMATNAYPALEKIDPKVFVKVLAAGEITVGAALLLPIVPAAVAGAGLMAFSGGLLGMYWRNPHLHRENDPRPTQDGVGVAKDVWLFGIGTGLVLDSATAPVHTKRVQVTQHLKDSAEMNAARTAAATERATGRARGALWGARRNARSAAKAAAKSARAGAKEAGHTVRATAVDAGHTVRATAVDAGHTVRASAKDAGQSLKSTAKGVADALPVG